MVDARSTRFDKDQAWALLQDAASVTIAKGKKVQTFDAVPAAREAILEQAMGPSGNLRAPTFRSGDRFVIGFNPELYADWLG